MAVGARADDEEPADPGAQDRPYVFGAGVLGVLYTMLSWWRDVIREATYEGYHTRVVQLHHRYGMILFIASEVMFFVAWFWAYFDASLYPNDPLQYQRTELIGGIGRRRASRPSIPGTCRSSTRSSCSPPAPRSPGRTTRSSTTTARAEMGPVADDRARPPLHLRAGLRIRPRRLRLQRQHLRRHLLHGDGLPWRARDHRHDLPRRVPVRAYLGPLHAAAASRLRVRRLVLALRRRGVAVPVRLHLCGATGRGRAAARTDGTRRRIPYEGRPRAALFRASDRRDCDG